VLRRLFGPKRDEATGEWRKLQHEKINDLYSSPIIIRVIKTRKMIREGHVARVGERSGTYRVLVRKLEEKKPIGRPRSRWENNIKMYLQDVGWRAWTGLIWIGVGTRGRHLSTRL
jgi:hypothetical protein